MSMLETRMIPMLGEEGHLSSGTGMDEQSSQHSQVYRQIWNGCAFSASTPVQL
jgi:hypothetical protein